MTITAEQGEDGQLSMVTITAEQGDNNINPFNNNYNTTNPINSGTVYTTCCKILLRVTIFFDREKAYDTTWKNGILVDLWDLGFRGHLPRFIQSFLCERSFKVRVGSTLSELHEQEMGVPQGSILSPALF